jgi:hypothetical protein
MQKKQKRPLVLAADRVKQLTKQDLTKVEGGGFIPPKLPVA